MMNKKVKEQAINAAKKENENVEKVVYVDETYKDKKIFARSLAISGIQLIGETFAMIGGIASLAGVSLEVISKAGKLYKKM